MDRAIQCDQCPFIATGNRSLGVHRGRSHGDIDEVVVERLVSGLECEANPSEKRAAGIIMIKNGRSYGYISDALEVSTRTVSRWRRDVGLTRENNSAADQSGEEEFLEEEWDRWRQSK